MRRGIEAPEGVDVRVGNIRRGIDLRMGETLWAPRRTAGMILHLVGHVLMDADVLGDPRRAWALWSLLQTEPLETVAACVMPNHVHQIVDVRDPKAALRKFAGKLGAYARKLGYRRLWRKVPEPRQIVGLTRLRREVRYVHLNPCRRRRKLVADPLAWPWSTHRGAVGAELAPWVAPERMAQFLGYDSQGFVERFHGYVSGDPEVAVAGTPPPVAAAPSSIAKVPLDAVIAAAAAAAPFDRATRNRLSVTLARDQGWRDTSLLAEALEITPQQVRRLSRCAEPMLLQVGRLYLGDPRLRHVPGASRRL